METRTSVTAVSWIPSQAVTGLPKGAFETGFTHYDAPPPDRVGGLDWLRAMAEADGFRFANRLSVTVKTKQGRIASADFSPDSRSLMGGSTLRVGPWSTRLAGVEYPIIRHDPNVQNESASFTQTAGGRAGMPAPRRVGKAPYLQIASPTVWTTLRLTVHADGAVECELTGASKFPRHWVYGGDGALIAKSGTTDFAAWFRESFGVWTPWGAHDSPLPIAVAETALERAVSREIMHSRHKPRFGSLKKGTLLVAQGAWDRTLYLLLDGIVAVSVDGSTLGELGPGALIGERAFLEGGKRTATVTALTDIRVAAFPPEDIDRDALQRISAGHRRETSPSASEGPD